MRVDVQFSLPKEWTARQVNAWVSAVVEHGLREGAIGAQVGFRAKAPLDGTRYEGGLALGWGAAAQPRERVRS